MADAMESLRKTLELCLDRLAPEATETTNRLLFPDGIEAIHINATLGLGNKGFSLDIDIPGPKADAPHGEPKAADGLGEFHLPQFAQALDDSHALATSQDVVNACKSVFPQHQFACNDFVTAVTFFWFCWISRDSGRNGWSHPSPAVELFGPRSECCFTSCSVRGHGWAARSCRPHF